MWVNVGINYSYIMIDLKQLMFDRGINQTSLAEILGVTQPTVSKLIKGAQEFQKYQLDALVEYFGDDVIKAYTIPNMPMEGVKQEAQITILDKEMVDELKEELIEEVRAEEIKKTIVLSSDVIRDPKVNLKEAFKNGELDEYAEPTQNILPLHHAKVYTFCDDMEPEIRAREAVLVRLLPRDTPIVPGDMYFFDLPSGGIIRYAEKEENGKLHLVARNSAYGDIIIDKSEVQSMAMVVQILRTPRSMSHKESVVTELLFNKDKHLDRLLDEMAKGGERERMLIEYLTKEK